MQPLAKGDTLQAAIDQQVVTNPTDLHLLNDGPAAELGSLVRKASTGDRKAMERLLTRAQESAYRFSLLVCGHPEDAEDVMQEALLSTYRRVQTITNPDAFRTWLYRTVRNACLMKRRRHVGEPARLASLEQGQTGIGGSSAPRPIEIEDASRRPDEQMMDGWIGRRLRRAMLALPGPYRAIVALREIEGLSTKEVAKVTGLSEANVKTRLHRARVLLRQELEDL
jgi:RNA polymerase sigma-70 factor (ECF subfamily)